MTMSMIKNYNQFILEDIRSKKILPPDITYDNLKIIYPSIKISYNSEYKACISHDDIIRLNTAFYEALEKDYITKEDIIFENCELISLYIITKFTKISDYGTFGNGIKDFNCYGCLNLTSLEGAPDVVTEDFNCNGCGSLTSLEGSPETIGGNFYCSGCKKLTSLDGSPEKVSGDFYCYVNSGEFIKLAKQKYGDKVKV